MNTHNLCVVFVGQETTLEPGTVFTFGRDADLIIDDNEYLHRQLGMFAFHQGAWHLHNVGSAISIEVLDAESANHLSVTPGTAVRLPFEDGLLRFKAGRAQYEIEIRGGQRVPAVARATTSRGAGDTMTPLGRMELTHEQRLLLVALAEIQLLDRGAPLTAIGTNQAIVARLGWSRTKYNRKLDRLCESLADSGVAGLVGTRTSKASHRRVRLVEYVLNTRIITEADLPLLDRTTS